MKHILIKCAIIVAALSMLLVFAGCDGPVTEKEAIKIADGVVAQDFPDMVDAERATQSYTSKDREFYEFTYSKTTKVESEDGVVELPQIVIVTIDKNTGEQVIAVSG